MIQYNVPSEATPRLDAALQRCNDGHHLGEDSRNDDTNNDMLSPINVEIILDEKDSIHACKMELGRTRDTTLGIGLLVCSDATDATQQLSIVIRGNNSTLCCGLRLIGKNINVVMIDCIVENSTRNNNGYGIFVQNAKLEMKNCIVTRSKIGVWAYLNSTVHMIETTITGNTDIGVAAYYAKVTTKKCKVLRNGRNGIVCSGKSSCVQLVDTSIEGHGESGLLCTDYSSGILRGGNVSYNEEGIVASEGAIVHHYNTLFDANECDACVDGGGEVKEVEVEEKKEEVVPKGDM